MSREDELVRTLNDGEKRIYDEISSTPPNKARCQRIVSNIIRNVLGAHSVGLDQQLKSIGACNNFELNFTSAKLCFMLEEFPEFKQ